MPKLHSPRRSQADRTRVSREKIIQAATELFAQQGFRGAKMSSIAKAADLTEPGLLHHFPSKTHLLMGVLEERDRVDSQRMNAILEKNGNHFVEAWTKLVEHNETVPGMVQLFTLLVAESISPDHPAHDFFVQRYQSKRKHMTQRITQAQEAGRIRSDIPAKTLTVLIFALMDGLQVQWLLEPEKMDMAAAFRTMMDILKPTTVRKSQK